MGRMPGAVWDPLAADWAQQPRMRGHHFVVVHTMVGSLAGTDDWFRWRNGRGYDGTESHFGTGHDGRIEQWQDIACQAEANLDGNGDCISIENADVGVGFPVWNLNDASQVPAFTDAQVEANARIIAWACSREAHRDCPTSWVCHQVGIPMVLVPDTRPGRRGVAYHRQGVDPYRVAGGTRWSSAYGKECPGRLRIGQISSDIIPRAQQLAGGAAPVMEDPDMPFTDEHAKMLEHLYRTVTPGPGKAPGQIAKDLAVVRKGVAAIGGKVGAPVEVDGGELAADVIEGLRPVLLEVAEAAREGSAPIEQVVDRVLSAAAERLARS